ncbi:hypothetical protein ACQJBY_055332 [Aegilops geniculata]
MFFFRDCREHGPPYGRRCHPYCRCLWHVAAIFLILALQRPQSIHGSELLPCYTYTCGKLKLGSLKLSSKLHCRSSKNSVTTAGTRASFFSTDSR